MGVVFLYKENDFFGNFDGPFQSVFLSSGIQVTFSFDTQNYATPQLNSKSLDNPIKLQKQK